MAIAHIVLMSMVWTKYVVVKKQAGWIHIQIKFIKWEMSRADAKKPSLVHIIFEEK